MTPSLKEFCSRDLSTACCRWFNSTTTEGLVKVVYRCSFQSLWLQQPPIEAALQRRIFLGADTTWRHKKECGIEGGGGGGEGWGTVQTLVQKGAPPLPSHHVIIFWPLTVCGCTRKGCTLEHPPLCRLPLAREILLCEQRQKCPKTITFFNIPGIKFRGKMQRSFHFKKSASYHRFRWYATFENKTPAETFPKFPSIMHVIDRSDRNPPITAP